MTAQILKVFGALSIIGSIFLIFIPVGGDMASGIFKFFVIFIVAPIFLITGLIMMWGGSRMQQADQTRAEVAKAPSFKSANVNPLRLIFVIGGVVTGALFLYILAFIYMILMS